MAHVEGSGTAGDRQVINDGEACVLEDCERVSVSELPVAVKM